MKKDFTKKYEEMQQELGIIAITDEEVPYTEGIEESPDIFRVENEEFGPKYFTRKKEVRVDESEVDDYLKILNAKHQQDVARNTKSIKKWVKFFGCLIVTGLVISFIVPLLLL